MVKTHSVDLSSNIISGLSAERLLNLHSNDIERRYFRAAEYRFRVTHEQMVSRLQRLQDTWQHYEHVRSYLKINVFTSGTSLINRVKRAITNMDSLVMFIIHTEMFANLGNYSAAYRKYLEPSIKTIDQAHGDIITAITAFSDMLISYNYEKMPGKTENQYGNLAKKGNKLLSTLEQWFDTIEFYQGKNSAKGIILPDYITRNATMRKLCSTSNMTLLLEFRKNVVDVLNDIKQTNADQNFHRYYFKMSSNKRCYKDLDVPLAENINGRVDGSIICYARWANHSNVIKLHANIRKLQEAFRQSEICHWEYGKFLQEVTDWLEKADMSTNKQQAESYDFVDMLQDINDTGFWLQNLSERLMLKEISLVDVAIEIHRHERDTFALNMENVKDKISQLTITPLQNLINEKQISVIETLLRELVYYESFSNYFNDTKKNRFTQTARHLVIWRKPVPNLDSPKVTSHMQEISLIYRLHQNYPSSWLSDNTWRSKFIYVYAID